MNSHDATDHDATNHDATDYEASRRDAEKSWHDPVMLRTAAIYVVSVIALAAAAFAAMAVWHSMLAAIMVPVILTIGSVGAMVRTYQVYKAGGVWPIWHGATWILLVFVMMFFDVPLAVR